VTLHRQSPAFPDFENQLLGDQNRALRKPSLFESVIRSPILPETGACEPGRILKMNARLDVRDALLVHKMKRWALIARYPAIGKGCPVWRARKNFWALQRKYAALAAKYGMTPTSVL
jgi:hypothetical protein